MTTRTLLSLLFLALVVGWAKADGDDRGGERDGRNRGGGKGDPVMGAFDGTVFDFAGMPGHYYNLVSDYPRYQLATKLKFAELTGHNGTYMDGMGFRYRGLDIVAESGSSDMKVTVGGEALILENDEASRSIVMHNAFPVNILFRKYWPELGEAIQFKTNEIEVLISMTAAGTKDFGGLLQPAYLNFNVTLTGTPSGELQGVIGETYNYMADARKASSHRYGAKAVPVETPKYPLYPQSAYELANYFAAPRVEITTVPEHMSERARIQRSLIQELANALEPMQSQIQFPISAGGFGK